MRVSSRVARLSVILLLPLLAASPDSFAQDTEPPAQSTTPAANSPDDNLRIEAGSADAPADGARGAGLAVVAPAPDPPTAADSGIQTRINDAFGTLNGWLAAVMFYGVPIPGSGGQTIPLAVLWLIIGAVCFTIRMKFINLRGFRHAIQVTTGKFDDPEDAGEVSHFQALTAALSATVGLGNIAGVAIAVAMGGPGATFWMIMAGILGMSSKFVECTLGQKYREVRPDGHIMGGAMFYLSKGLGELGMGGFGRFLAVVFAVLCIGGSFGGGCAFQVNQSLNAVAESIPFLQDKGNAWVYGLAMTVAVGVVIIGGIRSIARVAEKIVPLMCGVYLLACLIILATSLDRLPWAISLILERAFTPNAAYGGLVGVLVMGFQRAAFSNEAGVGSAAIAHSAAKTDHPVREGIVALLEPFIDTVMICTVTALVIVVSGAFSVEFAPDPNNAEKMIPVKIAAEDFASEKGDAGVDAATATMLDSMRQAVQTREGARLTSLAMDAHIPGFRFILALAVTLFAYSTMISWSYYGERCWAYLFGDGSSMAYRMLFLVFVFLGAIVSATNVLEFGDLMILGMAFPNIIGLILLSGKVSRDLDDYWRKLTSGEFDREIAARTKQPPA